MESYCTFAILLWEMSINERSCNASFYAFLNMTLAIKEEPCVFPWSYSSLNSYKYYNLVCAKMLIYIKTIYWIKLFLILYKMPTKTTLPHRCTKNQTYIIPCHIHCAHSWWMTLRTPEMLLQLFEGNIMIVPHTHKRMFNIMRYMGKKFRCI